MNNDYIEIGKIVNTFGLKGELKITSESDFIDYRFAVNKTIYIKYGNIYEPHKISSKRITKGTVLITIDNLNDINLVTKYIGSYVYALSSDKPPLKENKYMVDELVGKLLYDENDLLVGTVIDVIKLPTQSVLEVSTKESNILVPFVKEFIINVSDTIKMKILEIDK